MALLIQVLGGGQKTMNLVPDPLPDTALETRPQQSSVKSARLLGLNSLHMCILSVVPWRPPCWFVQHFKVRDLWALIRLTASENALSSSYCRKGSLVSGSHAKTKGGMRRGLPHHCGVTPVDKKAWQAELDPVTGVIFSCYCHKEVARVVDMLFPPSQSSQTAYIQRTTRLHKYCVELK